MPTHLQSHYLLNQFIYLFIYYWFIGSFVHSSLPKHLINNRTENEWRKRAGTEALRQGGKQGIGTRMVSVYALCQLLTSTGLITTTLCTVLLPCMDLRQLLTSNGLILSHLILTRRRNESSTFTCLLYTHISTFTCLLYTHISTLHAYSVPQAF